MAELLNKEYDDKSISFEPTGVIDDRDSWDIQREAIKFYDTMGMEPDTSMDGGLKKFEVYEISSSTLNDPDLQQDTLAACVFRDGSGANSMFAIYDEDKEGSLFFYSDNIKENVKEITGVDPDEHPVVRIGDTDFHVMQMENVEKTVDIGRETLEIENRIYKEQQHKEEIEWSKEQEPPIIESHVGNRSMVAHESEFEAGDFSDAHSYEAASYSSRSDDDYKDREDIVMVIGPERTSVFIKAEIADFYAEKIGVNINFGKNDSMEEREEKTINAFGGNYYEFGDSKYIKEEIDSPNAYTFASLGYDCIKDAAKRDDPEIELPKQEPNIGDFNKDITPTIGGR